MLIRLFPYQIFMLMNTFLVIEIYSSVMILLRSMSFFLISIFIIFFFNVLYFIVLYDIILKVININNLIKFPQSIIDSHTSELNNHSV